MRKSWHLNLLLAHSVVPPCVVVGSVLDKSNQWEECEDRAPEVNISLTTVDKSSSHQIGLEFIQVYIQSPIKP